MHHTIDKIPLENEKNILAKKHSENQTGTSEKYNPVKIEKKIENKNMKLGNKLIFSFIFLNFFLLMQRIKLQLHL